MKIVPKLQAGGVAYTPHLTPLLASSWLWATLQAQLQGSAATTAGIGSSGSSKSESDSLLTKDIIKDIYKNGLPNDVDAFLLSVDVFGNDIMEGSASPTQYKQLLSYLNKVTYNKEVFDQGLKTALQKGIMQLPAIDSNGYVYIKRASGALTKKRVSQLGDNDIKNILSYGELATIRANDPNAAFDGGTIAEVLAGGISVSDVYKSVQDIANKIGNDSIEKDDIKLKSSREQAIVEGVQEIMSLPDGVYKVTEKKDTQSKKALIALRYILESLTPQQNAAIALQAKITGTSPLLIIADGITYTLNDSEKYSINWQKYKDGEGNSGSGSGTGKGKTYEMDYLMQIVTGDGLLHTTIQITPGTKYAYQISALEIPWILKADGNGTVEPGSATDALLTSSLGRILNTNAIHVGELRIDPHQLNRMYYSGDGAKAVVLPLTYDKNGQPMPNFELIGKYEKVMKEIERQGGVRALGHLKVNQIFRNNGFGDYFLPDGKGLNTKNFMRFIGISLISDESIFQDPDETPNVFTKIDDEEDYLRNDIISALTKDKKRPIQLDGDLYRATAYIPIYDSFSNARVASGQSPWVSDPGYAQNIADEQYTLKLRENPPKLVITTHSKTEI